MKRVWFTLAAFGLLAGVLALNLNAAPPKLPKKDSVEVLMKKKLVQSQKVLEGIALNDPDLVAKHAQELLHIAKQAAFKEVLKTPLYDAYSLQFRNDAEDLIKSAKKKNIEAAALAYMDLTLTCVKCHKHVREKRMARLVP